MKFFLIIIVALFIYCSFLFTTVDAGVWKKIKREVNRVGKKVEREGKRIAKQVEKGGRKVRTAMDGTNDCKHNCQHSSNFDECFKECKKGTGITFTSPEVKIDL